MSAATPASDSQAHLHTHSLPCKSSRGVRQCGMWQACPQSRGSRHSGHLSSSACSLVHSSVSRVKINNQHTQARRALCVPRGQLRTPPHTQSSVQSADRTVQARTAVTKHPICAQVAGGRVSKEMHALLPRHVTASPAVTAGRRVCSTMLIEGRGDHLGRGDDSLPN